MMVSTGRALAGFLIATASGAAVIALLYIIVCDISPSRGTVFLLNSHLIEDAVLFSMAWIALCLMAALLGCIPFLMMLLVGNLLQIWSLTYAIYVGALTSMGILLSLFLFMRTALASISMEQNLEITGAVLAAGVAGGFLFWWFAIQLPRRSRQA